MFWFIYSGYLYTPHHQTTTDKISSTGRCSTGRCCHNCPFL